LHVDQTGDTDDLVTHYFSIFNNNPTHQDPKKSHYPLIKQNSIKPTNTKIQSSIGQYKKSV